MRKYACRAFLLRAGAIGGFGLAMLCASNASAHIQLIDPPPRYLLQGGDNGIKSCPCGLGGSNRVCNVAADGSDPDRSERVSRFEAGSTLVLRFQEFVNHAGRFRVAFDPDGADMADFNDNILNDIQDPANANGMVWEIPITLPNMTCDNCTLQLVQAMEVDQNTPIADPARISSYYSCVDIQLVAPGTPDGEPTEPSTKGEPDEAGMPSGDTGDDDTADGGTRAEQPGATPSGDGATGSQSAGDMSGTPLIPVSSGTPMDASGSTGSTSATPGGAVAMSGATGAPPSGALPGVGLAQPLPDLADPNDDSASSGCSLPSGDGGGSAIGLGVFGVFALLGLRRRAPLLRERSRRP